jgi:hypothetical protein
VKRRLAEVALEMEGDEMADSDSVTIIRGSSSGHGQEALPGYRETSSLGDWYPLKFL